MKRVHVLGIGGTFMGGAALLARGLGLAVEGSDANIYPPMSDQLASSGIPFHEGYLAEHLQPEPDLVVVGNALARGNPAVEYLLRQRMACTSGPHWLAETVLRKRRVLAVAGTHGKTTTSSLLAHMLDANGREPGFLIGGIPGNFGVSARLRKPVERVALASNPCLADEAEELADSMFVIEADEYDSAFFDKRSKFVHYRPDIAILNNLEYDHADIFPDLAAIQRQFHHLVRTIPGNGSILAPADDPALDQVLAMGCWTPVARFGIGHGDWQAKLLRADGSAFRLRHGGATVGEVEWPMLGRHNVMNALAAIGAAHAGGISAADALAACATFAGIKRRLERVGDGAGITVYDDFAHHPTAIAETLDGLRKHVGTARILVALEPRSNSMRQGAHAAALAPSLAKADAVVLLARPELDWDAGAVTNSLAERGHLATSVEEMLALLTDISRSGDRVVFMSNGSFENAPRRFLAGIRNA